MPKRIVDGEGLWGSTKLGQVMPVRFRAEYANLLPLAMANGVFEFNPQHIWGRAYATNRPDITRKTVEKILEEYRRVDLLRVWHDEGTKRTWGYWVGIDKKGRLPSPSSMKRLDYEKGPVPPPSVKPIETNKTEDESHGNHMGTTRESQGNPMLGIGIGIGMGRGIGSGLENANPPPSTSDRQPVQQTPAGNGTEPISPELQTLLNKIGTVAGNSVTFNQKQSVTLSQFVEKYSVTNVFLGFQSFYNTLDDHSIKFAAKDFVEKGEQIILNRIAASKKQEEQQAISDRLTAEGQAEVKRLQEEYKRQELEEAAASEGAPEL